MLEPAVHGERIGGTLSGELNQHQPDAPLFGVPNRRQAEVWPALLDGGGSTWPRYVPKNVSHVWISSLLGTRKDFNWGTARPFR